MVATTKQPSLIGLWPLKENQIMREERNLREGKQGFEEVENRRKKKKKKEIQAIVKNNGRLRE
jgi:hypothetical protein